jgi:hypothetical protein
MIQELIRVPYAIITHVAENYFAMVKRVPSTPFQASCLAASLCDLMQTNNFALIIIDALTNFKRSAKYTTVFLCALCAFSVLFV